MKYLLCNYLQLCTLNTLTIKYLRNVHLKRVTKYICLTNWKIMSVFLSMVLWDWIQTIFTTVQIHRFVPLAATAPPLPFLPNCLVLPDCTGTLRKALMDQTLNPLCRNHAWYPDVCRINFALNACYILSEFCPLAGGYKASRTNRGIKKYGQTTYW